MLSRWFGIKNVWKGYGRKSSGSFEFYVRMLLPRYYHMWQVWHSSKCSCHREAGLWGSKGISEGGMLKGKITSRHPFPDTLHKRVLRRLKKKGLQKKDRYGLFAYVDHVTSSLHQVRV